MLDVPLDVLHHHDRIIHHDADGEHQAEQAQRIDRKAEQMHDGEGADYGDRHRNERNDRGAPGLQEQHHHDHHQHDGIEQRVHDGLDGRAHELRGVIRDFVGHALGHVLLDLAP